jgi:hypothetical protein
LLRISEPMGDAALVKKWKTAIKVRREDISCEIIEAFEFGNLLVSDGSGRPSGLGSHTYSIFKAYKYMTPAVSNPLFL